MTAIFRCVLLCSSPKRVLLVVLRSALNFPNVHVINRKTGAGGVHKLCEVGTKMKLMYHLEFRGLGIWKLTADVTVSYVNYCTNCRDAHNFRCLWLWYYITDLWLLCESNMSRCGNMSIYRLYTTMQLRWATSVGEFKFCSCIHTVKHRIWIT